MAPTPALVKHLLVVTVYISGWYASSIFLNLYNKWFFSNFGFKFALSVTMVHMFVKGARDPAPPARQIAPNAPMRYAAPLARTAMAVLGIPNHNFGSWQLYASQVIPTAVATSLDVALSNMSLVELKVSFYLIVKSSVPIWIMLMSFALGLKRPSLSLAATILLLSVGISVASYGEIGLSMKGFLMCLGASMCAGVRWACSQVVLQRAAKPQVKSAQVRRAARVQWTELPHALSTSWRKHSYVPPGAGIQTPSTTDPPTNGRTSSPPTNTTRAPARGGDPGLETFELLRTARDEDGAAHSSSAVPSDGPGPGKPLEAVSEPVGDEDEDARAAGATSQQSSTPVHPLTFLFHISPWAGLTLIPAVLGLELDQMLQSDFVTDRGLLVKACALSSIGAGIAFFLIIFELLLVRVTSGLTLSVAGIFKEVLNIAASIVVRGEEFSLLNAIGLLITLVGLAIYNVSMVREKSKQLRQGGAGHAL